MFSRGEIVQAVHIDRAAVIRYSAHRGGSGNKQPQRHDPYREFADKTLTPHYRLPLRWCLFSANPLALRVVLRKYSYTPE